MHCETKIGAFFVQEGNQSRALLATGAGKKNNILFQINGHLGVVSIVQILESKQDQIALT